MRDRRVVKTNTRCAAERQIHAAIAHYRAGEFECAITLCHAAEGKIPAPPPHTHLFRILKQFGEDNPAPDGQKDDFNFAANWMKHSNNTDPDEVSIEDYLVIVSIYRAVSKYRAFYGIGTPEMIDFFPWSGIRIDSISLN